MELIPGTDLNRRVQDAGLQRQISTDTENYARMANANAKEGKADNYDVKEVVDNRQGSPTFGQTIYAGVNKTDPTDVRYSPLQVAPTRKLNSLLTSLRWFCADTGTFATAARRCRFAVIFAS
jgi:hypothetical protein